jgi:hypothetical protein
MDHGHDFVWCDVQWVTAGVNSKHRCARHSPLHTQHVCCCGDICPPEEGIKVDD